MVKNVSMRYLVTKTVKPKKWIWRDPPTMSSSSSADFIYYNKQCEEAIRSIGLPRIWKRDDSEFPVETIVTTESVVDLPIKYVLQNGSETFEHLTFPQVFRPMLACLHQDTPQLITELSVKYMRSPDGKALNLSRPVEDFVSPMLADSQSLEVEELIFKGKLKNGFFVEAGGYNFEKGSTSLYFELKHGWTGLLIEPYTRLYRQGLTKHRNITSINACLSPVPHAAKMKYSIDREGLTLDGVVLPESTEIEVECFPLYSMLLALGNPTVNYFSLDIEGAEFQVLQTIPWEKVDIQVLSIETHFVGERSAGSKEELIDFLDDKGYKHFPGAHKVEDVFFHYEGIARKIYNDLFVRRDVACKSDTKHC